MNLKYEGFSFIPISRKIRMNDNDSILKSYQSLVGYTFLEILENPFIEARKYYILF